MLCSDNFGQLNRILDEDILVDPAVRGIRFYSAVLNWIPKWVQEHIINGVIAPLINTVLRIYRELNELEKSMEEGRGEGGPYLQELAHQRITLHVTQISGF